MSKIETHIANLENADPEIAVQAQRRLIRFGAKAAECLIAATTHSDPQVRFRAVWALGKIGDRRGYDAVLRLTTDPDLRVAYDATLALGELGDARAVAPLEAIIAQNADDGLTSAAMMALHKLKNAETNEELCRPLK